MAARKPETFDHIVDDIPGVGRQAIEDNPLTSDEMKMFEMFEREGWSPERRRSHIMSICQPKVSASSR